MRPALSALVPLLLLMLGGCGGHPAERARFEAEKGRYWAERGDIRFALASNPSLRRGYLASASRHLAVAEIAASGRPHPAPDHVRDDLARLEQQARLRAGTALLLGGDRAASREQLEQAAAGPGVALADEARWLLVREALELGELERSLAYATELFPRGGREGQRPGEALVELPLQLSRAAARDSSQAEPVLGWARRVYGDMARRWRGSPVFDEALYRRHEVALLAGQPDSARADLERLARGSDDALARQQARFTAATLALRSGRGAARADSVLRDLATPGGEPALRDWARLRLAQRAARRGEGGGTDSLRVLSRDPAVAPAVAAEADRTLAEVAEAAGRLTEAVQLHRRILVRFPGTRAGLQAPSAIIRIQRRSGDPGRLRNALVEATRRWDEVLAVHPADAREAVEARRRKVEALLELGEAEDAVLELERLHHVRGASADGLEALLRAADISRRRLGDEARARRYLELVLEQAPGSPWAARATTALDDAPGIAPPGDSP